jgi:hypothetical protein
MADTERKMATHVRDLYVDGGHCRICGAVVGLGGPDPDDDDPYVWMRLHWFWHHPRQRTGAVGLMAADMVDP